MVLKYCCYYLVLWCVRGIRRDLVAGVTAVVYLMPSLDACYDHQWDSEQHGVSGPSCWCCLALT